MSVSTEAMSVFSNNSCNEYHIVSRIEPPLLIDEEGHGDHVGPNLCYTVIKKFQKFCAEHKEYCVQFSL